MKYVKAKKQNYLWMIIIFSSPIWHFIVYKAYLHVTCTANFLGKKNFKNPLTWFISDNCSQKGSTKSN